MFVIWEAVKSRVQEMNDHFSVSFAENPSKYFRRLVFLLILSLLLTIAMFLLPEKIREEQVNSLVYSSIPTSKLKPFAYSQADQKIKQSRAISVMFSKPNGKTYQDVLDVFNDPELMEELNRPIFYYPIVYDVHELEQKYNIRTDEVTFIFFDGGKEANRITAGEGGITDFDKELIPELNRLPLANIKQLEEEMDRTGTASPNAETAN
ncbi:TPA: hypothetical protein QFT42_001160 [Enterococcus faecium]|uniref:hypothetical protein n=1 Tax=Enterococcus faecium TaxID=1352 RepID=UPI0002A35F9D|nr:hypothetical protein [Enterococcus faecium]ELB26155.1 hypothetical protein OIU_03788 [Enterococcus faecium EnGen0039]ELB62906.1 hypothetical protein OKQ_03067 [Enterococcus faecium EnGen0052]MBE5027169.1 hypothetical protein [Enterococcus faecium]CAH2253748.1 hypothetical protein ACOSJ1_CBNAJBGD_01712 [Enterococcus faecium]CAH2259486.1 hypothetical protein ACOSJ1_MOIKCCMD_01575 [Enterococcus faecium]